MKEKIKGESNGVRPSTTPLEFGLCRGVEHSNGGSA